MRPSMRRLLPALLVTGLLPASAAAQACLGNASFATNHLQMSGGFRSTADVEELGTAFTSGSNSVFAGLGVNSYALGGGDANVRVAGSLGYQVPVTASGRVQACPLIRASYGLPTDDYDGSGGELRTQSYGFGLAVGGALVRGERFAIVPSVQASVQRNLFRVSGGLAPVDDADTYGVVGFGVGFVMNESLSLRPSVSLPIRAAFDEPIFDIGLSLNYGGRR